MNNVVYYLEKTAEKFPSKKAFICEDDFITYSDLVYNAKKFATFLIKNGFKLNTPIAFYMQKSINSICVMFGVFYARCCYSFLDTSEPRARVEKKINLLDCKVVFTSRQTYEKSKEILKDVKIELVEDALNSEIDEELLIKLKDSFLDIDPLYINFTSGSTGIPKGVVVSHKNIIDFIPNFIKTFNINENNIFGNQAPFDFDVSAKDIYSAIFTGGTTVLIPRKYFSFPAELIDYLVEKDVNTIVWAVSAMCLLSELKGFAYKIPHQIKQIMFSGEPMPIKQLNIWKNFLPNATYVNLYGPTEITCNCTYYVLKDNIYDNIPIGKSFDNEKVFLLDDNNKLIDTVGVIGEICVSGSCVCNGYYKDKEKSSEVFIQNPLNDKYYERIYKTGDLATYNENFDLVYVSRKDFQIKHMGRRVELTEIEKSIENIEQIERACAIYDFTRKKIALFYIGEISVEELKGQMTSLLPVYMIASKIIKIDSMPLNKNGKIDREKLKDIGGIA